MAPARNSAGVFCVRLSGTFCKEELSGAHGVAGGRNIVRFSIGAVALAVALLLSGPSWAAEEAGKEVFNNNCRTCHSWKKDDNRLGPSLHGVIGRKAGSASGFAFSESMKSAGITWDEGTLDKFIANPDGVVPNNKMKPFTGIADAATRKQIIEVLKSNPD
jgi:cytochrome c